MSERGFLPTFEFERILSSLFNIMFMKIKMKEIRNVSIGHRFAPTFPPLSQNQTFLE